MTVKWARWVFNWFRRYWAHVLSVITVLIWDLALHGKFYSTLVHGVFYWDKRACLVTVEELHCCFSFMRCVRPSWSNNRPLYPRTIHLTVNFQASSKQIAFGIGSGPCAGIKSVNLAINPECFCPPVMHRLCALNLLGYRPLYQSYDWRRKPQFKAISERWHLQYLYLWICCVF